MPVTETNGEEWDRLEPIVALDALVELVVVGEYAGLSEGESKQKAKEALLLRTAGASVFEVKLSGSIEPFLVRLLTLFARIIPVKRTYDSSS